MDILRHHILVCAIALCFFPGCRDSYVETVSIVIQGDETVKDAIYRQFRLNARILTTHDYYLVVIAEPAPESDYTILQINKDSTGTYSMVLIDPITQKPTTKFGQGIPSVIMSPFEDILDQANNGKLQNKRIQ